MGSLKKTNKMPSIPSGNEALSFSIAEYYLRQIRPRGPVDRPMLVRLTYSLGKDSTNKRSVLLSTLDRRLINDKQKQQQWAYLVEETNQQSAGNFRQDKFLVNRIKNNPDQFSGLGIAIHHFGPVPVLMTGHTYTCELHGEIIEAEVALYYNRPGDVNKHFRGFFANNIVFLQSLDGDYGIIMQRYFEDVAKIFNAIAIRSGLEQAFAWAKLAEDFIGQSIQSKLRESVPDIDSWKRYLPIAENDILDERSVRCLIYENHRDDIFGGQYFRNTSMFFLNELYSHLGLESRSEEYLGRFKTIEDEYDLRNGKGAAVGLMAVDFNLNQLKEIRNQYLLDSFEWLNSQSYSTVWLQAVLVFVRFLLNLKRNQVDAAKGRIFISFNHRVPVSEQLKKQIEKYYEDKNANTIEVLTVEDLPADTHFIDVIQPRIWQCDRMLTIVPEKPNKIGGDPESGSYEWLIKEAEYAVFLGKTVTFLMERGYDKEYWESLMNNKDIGYLSPELGNLEERMHKLKQEFTKRIFIEFTTLGNTAGDRWEDLNAQMRETLDHNAIRASALRHNDMMKGFLMQFTRDNLLTIQSLYKHVLKEDIFKSNEADNFLYMDYGRDSSLPFGTKSECRKAFENTRAQIKARLLVIRGQRLALIEEVHKPPQATPGSTNNEEPIRRGNRYLFCLRKILRTLQPEISEDRLKNWGDTLLRDVLREKGI